MRRNVSPPTATTPHTATIHHRTAHSRSQASTHRPHDTPGGVGMDQKRVARKRPLEPPARTWRITRAWIPDVGLVGS